MVSHSVNPSSLFLCPFSLSVSFCTLYFHKCRKRSPLFACHPLLFLSCHHFCHLLSLPFSLFLLFIRVCYLSLSEWLWLLLQSLLLLWLNMSLVSHLLSNGLSKHQTLFHPSFRLFIFSLPPLGWIWFKRKAGTDQSKTTHKRVLSKCLYTHTYTLHIWYAFRMLHAHPPQKSLSTVFP